MCVGGVGRGAVEWEGGKHKPVPSSGKQTEEHILMMWSQKHHFYAGSIEHCFDSFKWMD